MPVSKYSGPGGATVALTMWLIGSIFRHDFNLNLRFCKECPYVVCYALMAGAYLAYPSLLATLNTGALSVER